MDKAQTAVTTHEEWLKVLAQYQQLGWGTHYPRERRTRKRSQLRAVARVTYLAADGREERVDNVTHQVLDVSPDSVAIHSYRKIAPETRLAVDMNVGDRRLRLLGKVVRCAGNLGTVRVGIALEFGARDDKEAADGG